MICSILEQFRPFMESGVPELNLPPLDPLAVDHITFKFFDATVEFNEVLFMGFKENIVKYSRIDPDEKYETTISVIRYKISTRLDI